MITSQKSPDTKFLSVFTKTYPSTPGTSIYVLPIYTFSSGKSTLYEHLECLPTIFFKYSFRKFPAALSLFDLFWPLFLLLRFDFQSLPATVPSSSLYVKTPSLSNFIFLIKSITVSKSSSVSPGNPEIIVVLSVIPGIFFLSLPINIYQIIMSCSSGHSS